MRGLLSITILALLVASGAANAQPRAIASGVYRDLKVWEGSGDANGIELTLRLEGQAPAVEFISCEGGCIEPIIAPATVSDGKVEFDIIEQTFDDQGAPISYTTHYVVTRRAGGLRLVGQNRVETIEARLKRTRWREH